MKNLLNAFSLWDEARAKLNINIKRNPRSEEEKTGVIVAMTEAINETIALLQAAKAQLK